MTSLRRELMIGFVAGMILLWLAAMLLAGAVLKHELEEVSDSSMQEAAERILSIAVVELTNTEEERPERKISPVREHDEHFTYAVYNREGRVLLYSHEAHRRLFSGDPQLGFWNRHGYRLYGVEAVSGNYRIVVAEPLEDREETLFDTLYAMAWPMAAILPLGLIGVFWFTGARLRPMQRLSSELHDRNESDLTPVTLAGLQREFLPLGGAINDLMARMARALDAERSFTSSAAHELRTPIAAALAQAQRLMREVSAQPDVTRTKAVIDELKRLARLSEKLLELARAEGAGVLRETPSDLVPVLTLLLDDFRREGSGARLEVDLPEASVSRLDPDAFGVLARNLIENALTHSPLDTPVQVRLGPDGTLAVSNAGPVIPPEQLARLTRRFERAHAKGPGSGLGLAIADSIARASSMKLTLNSPASGKIDGFEAVFSAGRQKAKPAS